jgi:hypothetical protein
MTPKPGLLRRLLGPASSKVVDLGAQHLPRASLADSVADQDPSGQQFAALVHVVWLVFAADDPINDEEIALLLEIIDDLTEGEAPEEAIEELFDAYGTLYGEVGVAGSAAILAIGAVSLDRTMSDHEERVLMMLASAFNYSSRQTQDLFDEVERSLTRG